MAALALASRGAARGRLVAPVRLGLIAPLTGSSADFGISMEQGAELAVDEINASGGAAGQRAARTVARDDRGDPATGGASRSIWSTTRRSAPRSASAIPASP